MSEPEYGMKCDRDLGKMLMFTMISTILPWQEFYAIHAVPFAVATICIRKMEIDQDSYTTFVTHVMIMILIVTMAKFALSARNIGQSCDEKGQKILSLLRWQAFTIFATCLDSF